MLRLLVSILMIGCAFGHNFVPFGLDPNGPGCSSLESDHSTIVKCSTNGPLYYAFTGYRGFGYGVPVVRVVPYRIVPVPYGPYIGYGGYRGVPFGPASGGMAPESRPKPSGNPKPNGLRPTKGGDNDQVYDQVYNQNDDSIGDEISPISSVDNSAPLPLKGLVF